MAEHSRENVDSFRQRSGSSWSVELTNPLASEVPLQSKYSKPLQSKYSNTRSKLVADRVSCHKRPRLRICDSIPNFTKFVSPLFADLEQVRISLRCIGPLVIVLLCKVLIVIGLLVLLLLPFAAHFAERVSLPSFSLALHAVVESTIGNSVDTYRIVFQLFLFATCVSFLHSRQALGARWETWVLLCYLQLTIITIVIVKTSSSTMHGKLSGALKSRDGDEAWNVFRQVVFVNVGVVFLTSVGDYLEKMMYIRWRRNLVDLFIGAYMADQRYFKMNTNDEDDTLVDNPDQRMTKDVADFTREMLNLVRIFGMKSFLFAVNASLVYYRSPRLGLAILGWFLAVIVSVFCVGMPFVRAKLCLLRYEGDFRYGLTRIRRNAEAIAFYAGEVAENLEIRRRFELVRQGIKRVLMWELVWEAFKWGFTYGILPLCDFVLLGPYFRGDINFAQLEETRATVENIRFALSFFLWQFPFCADVWASAHRLDDFHKAMENIKCKVGLVPDDTSDNLSQQRQGAEMAFANVSLLGPFVKNLNLHIQRGERILISGPSGCGKTSLLRVVCGLWQPSSGQVLTRPGLKRFFLPQKPYLTLGSLRQQICYPQLEKHFSESQLRQVLRQVHLGYLCERYPLLDVEEDWPNVLSLGEQQRLAFARLLLSDAEFAVLDESTSSMDLKLEREMYELLTQRGLSIISVAHRPSLIACHDRVLELQISGGWRIHSEITRGDNATNEDTNYRSDTANSCDRNTFKPDLPAPSARNRSKAVLHLLQPLLCNPALISMSEFCSLLASSMMLTIGVGFFVVAFILTVLANFVSDDDDSFTQQVWEGWSGTVTNVLGDYQRPFRSPTCVVIIIVSCMSGANFLRLSSRLRGYGRPWLLLFAVSFNVSIMSFSWTFFGPLTKMMDNTLTKFSEPEDDQRAFLEMTAGRIMTLKCVLFGIRLALRVLKYWFLFDLRKQWRAKLVDLSLSQYLENKVYYAIKIDTPEQRMSDDISAMTTECLEFYWTLVDSMFDMSLGLANLTANCGMLSLYVGGTCVVGSMLVAVLFRQLSKHNIRLLSREGDLRASLIHVRDNAEPVAFYGGEEQEKKTSERMFDALVSTFQDVARWEVLVQTMASLVWTSVELLPWAVMITPFARGEYDFGDLSAAKHHANTFKWGFCLAFMHILRISRMAACADRVMELFDSCTETRIKQRGAEASRNLIPLSHGPTDTLLKITNVNVHAPDGKCLIERLNLTLCRGNRLLIVGPSGCGKTTLLRNIAGLVEPPTGSMQVPLDVNQFFVPQRPYMTLGTLQEQLCYPKPVDAFSEADISAALSEARLEYLNNRWDDRNSKRDWARILSLGEQQRIGFARILLHKPEFVVLDESTSSLDLAAEKSLYTKLSSNGVTFVSVGHRTSLYGLHDQILELMGGGAWRLRPSCQFTN